MVKMSIDDLVDNVLAKHINEDDEVKKDATEPKKDTNEPFRYITNGEEIQQELETEKPAPVSIMSLSDEKSIFELEQDIFILALGDLDTIESILEKHENIQKNRLE